MKPSEYIKKSKKWKIKDVHSLETLLFVWTDTWHREWKSFWEQEKKNPEYFKDIPEGRAALKTYKSEIALAEKTIANWKKELAAKTK